jgi:hypothetical protein
LTPSEEKRTSALIAEARELSVSGTIATTAQTPHGRHISTMCARDNALYAKLEKALDG